jgi:hypothetical protein
MFAPFFLEIDSNSGVLRIRYHWIATADLLVGNNSLYVNLKIGWWKKEYDLLKRRTKIKGGTGSTILTGKHKKINSFSSLKSGKIMKGLLASFHLKKCYIMIDTDDMPLNGILYPWFWLLTNQTKKNVMINFHGENIVILQLENTMARILWAYLKY